MEAVEVVKRIYWRAKTEFSENLQTLFVKENLRKQYFDHKNKIEYN